MRMEAYRGKGINVPDPGVATVGPLVPTDISQAIKIYLKQT